MSDSLIKINDIISYVKSSKEPLSSDVVLIEGKENTWIFDVGHSDEAFNVINGIKRHKCAVLSHFHEDHIGNIGRILEDECKDITLYVSKQTYKYTKCGILVNETIEIDDGVKIKIFPIPSSHSKGCLGVEINGEFAFLGDAIYPTYKNGNKEYNAQLLKEQIDVISSLSADKLFLSHEDRAIINRNVIVAFLKSIYIKRNPKENMIVIEEKNKIKKNFEEYEKYSK